MNGCDETPIILTSGLILNAEEIHRLEPCGDCLTVYTWIKGFVKLTLNAADSAELRHIVLTDPSLSHLNFQRDLQP